MGIRKGNFMRLQDKHLMALLNKEGFHCQFHTFMELDGKDDMMEIVDELGISREEVRLIKKKMSRT